MVISDNLSIDELSVDIEIESLLDLSLGKVFRSIVLGLLRNDFSNLCELPTLRDNLDIVSALINNLIGLWCFWLVLSNLLGVLAHSGGNELLDHLLVVAAGVFALLNHVLVKL